MVGAQNITTTSKPRKSQRKQQLLSQQQLQTHQGQATRDQHPLSKLRKHWRIIAHARRTLPLPQPTRVSRALQQRRLRGVLPGQGRQKLQSFQPQERRDAIKWLHPAISQARIHPTRTRPPYQGRTTCQTWSTAYDCCPAAAETATHAGGDRLVAYPLRRIPPGAQIWTEAGKPTRWQLRFWRDHRRWQFLQLHVLIFESSILHSSYYSSHQGNARGDGGYCGKGWMNMARIINVKLVSLLAGFPKAPPEAQRPLRQQAKDHPHGKQLHS